MSLFQFISAPPAKSDAVTLDKDNPQYRAELEVDRFKLKGKEYHRHCKVQWQIDTAKRKREPRSIWYRFGEKLLRLSDNKVVYYCYVCERKKRQQDLPVMNGTGPALDHLREEHQIDKHGNKIKVTVPAGQATLEQTNTLVTTYDFEEFKRLLLRWMVYCFIAFRMIENDYFRALLNWLNKGVGQLLPHAASTLRQWIINEYEQQKVLVIEELSKAISNVHLSFDLWSSPNHYAIMGIYGHFINAAGHRRTQLLAFRRLRGDHSGENQAQLIVEVINEYLIAGSIGYLVCDNAKSNDVAVAAVLKELFPAIKASSMKARRLRCFGHITNLCARAMLLGKGAGKALADIDRKQAKGAHEAIDAFWRKRGCIGRLHNLIRWIRWTPQRREAFISCKQGGKLTEFDNLMVSASIQITKDRLALCFTLQGLAL